MFKKIFFSLNELGKKQPQNPYATANSADLLICRAIGYFLSSQQTMLFSQNYFVCQDHVKELLKDWATSNKNHFFYKRNLPLPTLQPMCSFPNNIYDELHTRKTKIVGNDLPRLSRNEAEFVLNRYGVLLHVGLRKFSDFYKVLYYKF